MKGGTFTYAVVGVAVAIGGLMYSAPDILNGASDQFMPTTVIGDFSMNVAIAGFCMSGIADKLGKNKQVVTERGREYSEGKDFKDDGKIAEDEYQKASIYSVLYSLYANHPELNYGPTGEKYMFTFNTWGIYREDGNDDGQGNQWYDETFPQRMGMTAYRNLVEFDAVKEYLKHTPEPTFLEVGCGTGAGANLISGVITKDKTHPMNKCTYNALDMQGAAIKTCKNFHMGHTGKPGGPPNENLNCVHGNGQSLPFEDNSIDIVVVSETHIAELSLDPEAKRIIDQIKRVLKNGGLFVWGNALPTTAWNEITDYLPKVGFEMKHINNRTADGVYARDADKERCEEVVAQYLDPVFFLRLPFEIAKVCKHTLHMLIMNFYRQPDTDLYWKMATGTDSYMQICGKLTK